MMTLVMLWASPSLVSCECSLVPRSWAQKSLSGTGSQGTSQVLFWIFLDPRIPGLVPLRFARGHVAGHVGVPLLQARKFV